MDYSQLSDFEINCRVAYHIGLKTVERAEEGEFKPCENPADALPIITANKISIYAMSEVDTRGKWGAEAFYPNEAYHFNDNPLRAAMIVFLMMQDAKHA
ncbi:DUF2591 family protein [Citrobacter amalonaticus]|uniref:phage protein NinX family protein n=1 Tax=Citrobacter amalonaticus TaxID=35703 RepID=UPI001905740C|nr:phage protein NinX family protein [Citrobacter amalonaticus]MBJ9257275.1 DUF2591 family protein [Citrobacter amalonaticus]